ncbi:MAG TPA: DUF1080 domain-containing protein [Saprospiraceae bacterium]|nr:DUF1080 domain-containing protein [Saprospiraceae bacterium]
MKNRKVLLLLAFVACSFILNAQSKKDWTQLFNGKDLKDWKIKIKGYDLNENFGNTFSVKDKKIVVNYEAYDAFNFRYGHIFYKNPFSYYRIAVEYRFVGSQAKGGEDWAFRNSGIMIHGQTPESMLKDQDFPISIEVQLLGGKSDSQPRPTCNLCTPGTHVVYEGKLDTRHCIESKSATFDGDQWVRAEVEVLGDSLIRHFVNGQLVMEYAQPIVGGGVVNGFDALVKNDGLLLSQGSISLQSESHPIEFRKVELLDLKGCMNPKAKNYKKHYLVPDNSACRF